MSQQLSSSAFYYAVCPVCRSVRRSCNLIIISECACCLFTAHFMWFFSLFIYALVFCPYSLLPLSLTSIYLCIYVYSTHVSLFSFRFLLSFPLSFSFSLPCGVAAVGPLRVELSALINRVPMVILAIPPKTNNRRMFICAPSTDPDPCS